MSYYERHVFFCLTQRDDGSSCCCNNGAEEMFDYVKARVKKLGLHGKDKVRVNRAGCFDRCGEGPVVVVYPEAVWYTYVDQEDMDEIIDSHLLRGEVVERLKI